MTEEVDMPPGHWSWDDDMRDYYEIDDPNGEYDGAGLRMLRAKPTPPLEYNTEKFQTVEYIKFDKQECIMNHQYNKSSIAVKMMSIVDIFSSIILYLEIKDAIHLATTCKNLSHIMDEDCLWKTLHNYHFGQIENLVRIECSDYYPPRENSYKNRYIIRKSMRWGRHSREYQLSNNGLTATKIFNIESPISNTHSVFADVGLFSGKHYWEVSLDRYNWFAWAPFFLIGIVPADGVLDGQYIGWKGNGCCYTPNGTYLYEELNKSREGILIYHKDVVGVYLDLDSFSIKFFLNGTDLGWVYRDFNKDRKWKLPIHPAVGTAHSHDQFTINFNVPHPVHNDDNLFSKYRWDAATKRRNDWWPRNIKPKTNQKEEFEPKQ